MSLINIELDVSLISFPLFIPLVSCSRYSTSHRKSYQRCYEGVIDIMEYLHTLS